MPQVFSNGARAQLGAGIASDSTSLTITAGGSLYPVANYAGAGTLSIDSAENWFKLVLQDSDGYEVVYCYQHTAGSNTFSNLRRGQEGTTARAFTDAVVGLRSTAGDMTGVLGLIASKAAASHSHSAATTSTAGFMSAADKTKLDGIAEGANNYTYTLPEGTSTILGGFKLISDTAQTVAPNALTTTAARTYTVQKNAAGQLVVNVPWIDTNTTYTLPTATSTILGGTKLGSDTTQSVAANAVSATASRTYAVQTNGSGQMVVNVPWVDTNTTYEAVTTSVNGLMIAADKAKLDGIAAGAQVNVGTDLDRSPSTTVINLTSSTGTGTTLPAATTTAAGVMTAADKSKLNGIAPGATNNWVSFAFTSGSDLNSTLGQAPQDATAAVAATLLNCPTTNAFVFRCWRGDGYVQEVSEVASGTNDVATWRRSGKSNVWTPWHRVYTTSFKPTAEDIGAQPTLPAGTNGQVLKHNGTAWVAGTDNNTTYSAMSQAEADAGTATSSRVITAAVLKGAINTHAPVQTTITGNAGTATKLATARNLTIGSTAKAFDGSANVSWTLAEMGAAAESHTHSYLPLAGGSLSGSLSVTGDITATGNITAYSDIRLKTDLESISNAVERVKNLTGYTFTRKDTGERQTGLVAQDVLAMLPEAVLEKDGFLSVNYGSLVGLLVNAIKELEQRVAELEKKTRGN